MTAAGRDDYRVQLQMASDDIKVFTRRGNDWTKRFRMQRRR